MSAQTLAPHSIPEFFNGKSILITGGTGFLGRVLIEKLLRSCPQITAIYLLLREKKGKSPKARLSDVVDIPLFDRLRKEQPDAIEKIRIVTGNVAVLGLGLTPSDRHHLINTVNIIYHCAASIRFDDPLSDAIIMNTRGAREMSTLALEMKYLDVFVHVSTTYCNTNRRVIDEVLYPAHADWKMAIKMAEEMDKSDVEVLTAKYLGDLPNTYTFTKQLAEHAVNDLCGDKIPVVIFRPSIVISSAEEPISGWIDNFNGPVGLLVACGKGIVRTTYTGPDIISDYMPVDIAIKALIIATWKKGINLNRLEQPNPTFYNCSSHSIGNVTMRDMVHMGKSIVWQYPFNNQLWHITSTVTSSKFLYYLQVIFFHILPGFFIDLLLRVFGKPPILVKLQRKIYIANMAVQYFLTNEWAFLNKNTLALDKSLLAEDVKEFSFKPDDFDVYNYLLNAMKGARKYLLKEDESTLQTAIIHSRRMYLLYQIINFFYYVFGFWLIVYKIKIFHILYNFYCNLFLVQQ